MKRMWILGLILPAAVALADAIPADNEGTDSEGDYSRTFEKVLEAGPGAVFALENSFGDVSVGTWDQSKVSITADIRVDAASGKKAAEFGEKIRIDVIPSAERISVKTIYPTRAGSRSRLSFSVDYTVLLPARQAADVTNAFGDITVTGVQGALTVKGKHGGVEVMQCPSLTLLKNEFGSIDFESVGGKTVEVENQNGDIRGENVRGALRVDNRFGGVEIAKVEGDLAVRSANGDIEVESVSGAADIEDQFGSIRLSGSKGPVKIASGNGSVEATDIGGGEIRNSFGSVNVVNSTNAGLGLKIDNANGDIRVRSVKGDAILSASFGRIEAEDVGGNVTASAQNSSVEILNAGGTVDVEDTFGPVTVRDTRSDVSIRNQNGSIECAPLKAGKSMRLQSTFGSIKLFLPGDASATLRAETTFGAIESDFDVKRSESDTETTVQGILGGGESRIDVSNQNGNIEILKARPRK